MYNIDSMSNTVETVFTTITFWSFFRYFLLPILFFIFMIVIICYIRSINSKFNFIINNMFLQTKKNIDMEIKNNLSENSEKQINHKIALFCAILFLLTSFY